jgi:hypothetical protein
MSLILNLISDNQKTIKRTAMNLKPSMIAIAMRSSLRLLLLTLLLAPWICGAQTQYMSYQGYLTDGNGNALGSTNTGPKAYDVVFRIWDLATGGTINSADELFAELQTVTVDNGYFSVLLYQGTSYQTEPHGALSSVFTSLTTPRYVEMTVLGIGVNGASVTILPRLQLVAAPYSLLAVNAINVTGTNTITAGNLGTNIGLWTAGGSNVFYNGGNVGIGTSTPGFPLNFPSMVGDKISLYGQSGSHYGIGIQAGVLQIHNDTSSSAICFGYGSSANFTESMRVNGNGNVGIGTITPNALLEVNGNVLLDKNATIGGTATISGNTSMSGTATIAGNTTINNSATITGGVTMESSATIYDNVTMESSASVYGNETVYENLTVPYGYVGIGTFSPGFPLEVDGWNGTNCPAGYWYAFVPNSTGFAGGSHTLAIGIDSKYGILSEYEMVVTSDRRIKTDFVKSDSKLDLLKLNQLKVTDFNYIDKVHYGDKHKKGLIAQEVEEVFPIAVTKTKGVVPDIYKLAACKDGWVALATDLKKGERVKLITDKTADVYEVLEVTKDKFRTAFKPEGDHVIVFGREVDDFRALDYDAISILNVSATQELAKRMEKLEKQESRLADLEQKAARVDTLEQEVAELKKERSRRRATGAARRRDG